MSDISRKNININILKNDMGSKYKFYDEGIFYSLDELCDGNSKYSWYIAYENDNLGLFDQKNNKYYHDDMIIFEGQDVKFKSWNENVELLVKLSDNTKLMKKGNIIMRTHKYVILRVLLC